MERSDLENGVSVFIGTSLGIIAPDVFLDIGVIQTVLFVIVTIVAVEGIFYATRQRIEMVRQRRRIRTGRRVEIAAAVAVAALITDVFHRSKLLHDLTGSACRRVRRVQIDGLT